MTDHSGKPGHSEIVQHKAEVPPIFVVYCKVSADGECISLMQVATAVLQVMGDQSTIDVVQPMRQGWYIYMRTLKDCTMFVERGLTIARFVPLQSELRQDVTQSAKVTLKDLPLHSVGNDEVLEAVKEICSVTQKTWDPGPGDFLLTSYSRNISVYKLECFDLNNPNNSWETIKLCVQERAQQQIQF